jgi:hypothetical protein
MMVQLEDCGPHPAKQVAIVLDEHQFSTLNVALQEIDLKLVLYERIHIHECHVDSACRNIGNCTLHVHG